ncbi:hypothetical protein BC940DRAFT_274537 [Gongronella butleri]|nr:hypothetical protein BC940DRAFT_274537 [Gongronella butleri]
MTGVECVLSQPWAGNDFSPCFRQVVIDALFPTLVFAWFVGSLVALRRRPRHGYAPLKTSTPRATYGATAATCESPSRAHDTRNYALKPTRWTIFSFTRLLALLPWCAACYAFVRALLGVYTVDTPVEGSDIFSILVANGTRAIIWGYCFVLAILQLSLSDEAKSTADAVCSQLNALYFVQFVTCLVDLRSFYMVHDVSAFSTGYIVTLMSAGSALVMLSIMIHEERAAPLQPVVSDTGRVHAGATWASLYSRFTFSWLNALMQLGYQRTINDDDLPELPDKDRAQEVLAEYKLYRRSTVLMSLIYMFRWQLVVQFIYAMVWSMCIVGPAYFLNLIVAFIEDPASKVPLSTACLYAVGLFAVTLIQALTVQQALYIGRVLSIRIQAIIIGEVFAKTLRRRDTAQLNPDKDASGDVNNLLSVDAQKFSETFAYAISVYSYPLQIMICVVGLYRLLGVAAIWGVLTMFIAQPILVSIMNHFQGVQKELMSRTDKRLKLTNEMLGAIRIIKFFAWEREFRTRLMTARDVELQAIRKRLFMYMWMGTAWFIMPILIIIVVFYTYTRDHDLTASRAFTALALFSAFRQALDSLPFTITSVIQSKVSLARIEAYLKEDELEQADRPLVHSSGVYIGFVDGASFGWSAPLSENSKDEVSTPPAPTVVDLNLSFPRGKMSIVCGATGSGKTTLLASLLGETYRYSGSAVLPPRPAHTRFTGNTGIAYVVQNAWLQNASIRDNILFGSEYDEDRYRKVLYMTALTKDLDYLEHGDATEVGEKGITLSGGQKQRLSIARAVYSQADTIILDDCLSAVDAHTAKHLYDHCLKGELMCDRTVILVTHYVSLALTGASYIVVLDEGRVRAAGAPDAVLKSGALGEELALSKAQEMKTEKNTEEGPIPMVPNQATLKSGGNGHGKLVQEETRSEGGVAWSVYALYFSATGGVWPWIGVVFFFGLTQAIVVAQDYWIKIWANAYEKTGHVNVSTSVMTLFSVSEWQQRAQFISMPLLSSGNAASSAIEGQQVNITYYLGVYVAIGLFAVFISTVRLFVLYLGSLRASRRIHEQLLDRILRAKTRFFDTTPHGRIVNRLSSDLEMIDQEISPVLSIFIGPLVATLTVVFVISSVTPAFLIPGAMIAVFFCLMGIYYLRTSRELQRLTSVCRSPVYVQFGECVHGVATIRAFGCQERFIQENIDKVDNKNRPFYWLWVANRWLSLRVDIFSGMVSFCAGLALVLARNYIDAGLAGLSLSYALQFVSHALWVVRAAAMSEMNMNAVERISEYLHLEEEAPAHIPETKPRASWPEHGAIQVKDLVVRYAPETPAVLHNISFETKPRERVAIVGRTGSGKSTLCLSLFRFMEASSGTIHIDGVDISAIGLEDLRSKLISIPQEALLFSGTLRSNLDPFGEHDDATLWAALKRSHLISAKNTDHVDEDEGGIAASAITLDSQVMENGKNWSQGQRQLIALARALVKKSALIVLDEATSSIDFDTDRRIQRTIRTEFKDSAIICIAHRLRTICDYDRVLVLDQGKVVEFDTPYALMTKESGIFKQMCEHSGEAAELMAIARGTTISQPSSSTTTTSSASSIHAPSS